MVMEEHKHQEVLKETLIGMVLDQHQEHSESVEMETQTMEVVAEVATTVAEVLE